MIRYRSTLLLIAAFVTCCGWAFSAKGNPGLEPAIAQSSINFSNSLLLAQSNCLEGLEGRYLKRGSQGSDVVELQKKLKKLGYFDGKVDGVYGTSTEIAVSKFKKSVDLESSGIAGSTTWNHLQTAVAQKPESKTATASVTNDLIDQLKQLPWLVPGAAIGIAVLGGGMVLSRKPSRKIKKAVKSKSRQDQDYRPTQLDNDKFSTENFQGNDIATETDTFNPDYSTNGHNPSDVTVSIASHSVEKTTRLPKIDIVNELIRDLRGADTQKRRKAIWDLAQQGDSRAVQPLLDLLIDADSKQRSLILEALSQIGTKTLNPLNRALALSLQDDNADVRKNAIRDLTQIYDQVAQITQMLCHVADDPDPEVQETARWAMSHLSRIRTSASLDNLPSARSTLNLPSKQDQKA